MKIELVGGTPLVVRVRDVLPADELEMLLAKVVDRHWLASQRIPVRLDATGLSFHCDDSLDPGLMRVRQFLHDELAVPTAGAQSLRVRHYRTGQGHGAHGDHFEDNDRHLLVTAILYLTTPDDGGETRFVPDGPVLAPEANTLVAWINYLDDGSEDPATRHEGMPVGAGDKVIALFMNYGALTDVPALRSQWQTLGERA